MQRIVQLNLFLFLLGTSILALSACQNRDNSQEHLSRISATNANSANTNSANTNSANTNSANAQALAGSNQREVDEGQTNNPAQPSKQALPTQSPKNSRKITRDAQLRLSVENVDSAAKTINRIAENVGGMMLSENRTAYSDAQVGYTMQVQIPADRLDTVLAAMERLAEKTLERRITSRDVTAEYADAEARLASARRLEEQYFSILKQARTVADVLAAQEKLGEIRAEIEAREARFKAIAGSVEFSRVEIVLLQESSFMPETFGKRFGRALSESWEGLLSVILGLVQYWYLVLMLLVGIVIFRRFWHKRK